MNPITQRLNALSEKQDEMKKDHPSEAVILACEIIIRRTENIRFGYIGDVYGLA